jgi:TonB family protein
MDFKLPRLWRSRLGVLLVIAVVYVALYYGLTHGRARRSSSDDPAMFGPVVSEIGEHRGSLRPKSFADQDDDRPAATEVVYWIFPPIDIWPSPPGWSNTVSGLTPVVDAEPVIPGVQPFSDDDANRHMGTRSSLRMIRWLRPDYPPESAAKGKDGSVLLDLLIDTTGQPVDVRLARSSGFADLDAATRHAADSWRFALPKQNSPASVWAKIEVRYKH